MSQKDNPVIFRLGISKDWKSQFFEKKNLELPLYIFKDLEIKSFIERTFEVNKMIMHDFKQHFNTSILNLYVSFFVKSDFTFLIKKRTKLLIIKNLTDNLSKLHIDIDQHQILEIINNKLLKKQDSFKLHNLKKYLKIDLKFIIYSKSIIVKKKKEFKYLLKEFFIVLSLFISEQLNIIVTFNCLNKDFQFVKIIQQTFFIFSTKYKNTSFFREGIELLFYVVNSYTSANLLAKFIAIQIKKIKHHKYFLFFLKQILIILLNSHLSKVKGIKILLKGRLDSVPRAKHKIINICSVPTQTILSKIDYSQITTNSSTGSYGIKVWILNK